MASITNSDMATNQQTQIVQTMTMAFEACSISIILSEQRGRHLLNKSGELEQIFVNSTRFINMLDRHITPADL